MAWDRQVIQQLTHVGILREHTGHRRERLFAATEALSSINRPFGASRSRRR